MTTTSPRNPSPKPQVNTAPLVPNPQPRRQYRERDFGVGYGRSSGYASQRQYANGWNGQLLFRCG
jgi:hypothetical protein